MTRADGSKQATAVAGLVLWAEQTGRPVEAEVLLDQDVVEEYLGSLKDQGLASSTSRAKGPSTTD